MRAGGFTLIELLITAAIVGVLASAALPLAEVAVQRGKEQELRRALRQIREAIDEHKRAADEGRVARKADETGYPPTLRSLVEGVPDARSLEPKRIVFLRRIPRDPFHGDPRAAPEQTWGLRSHASPVDSPAAGNDVFDVHSLNAGTGLNGIPYREW